MLIATSVSSSRWLSPTGGLLFKHAVRLVQCIQERHFVLQHSSLHAHTSLSDMYHNYTGTHTSWQPLRFTIRQENHHQELRQLFSQQQQQGKGCGSYLASCLPVCTKSWRGVFPSQQDAALNGSVEGNRKSRASAENNRHLISSPAKPFSLFWSITVRYFDVEQQHLYQWKQGMCKELPVEPKEVKNESQGPRQIHVAGGLFHRCHGAAVTVQNTDMLSYC